MLRFQKVKSCIFQSIFQIIVKHSSTGKLMVEPVTSLVTESVSITGFNFQPNSPITIQASVNCSTERFSFKSKAYYITNKNGSFNLRDTESIGGSYSGIDGMGLFWSMVSEEGFYGRFNVINASTALTYNVAVFDGHIDETHNTLPIDNVTFNRVFSRNNVSRLPIKSGNLRGTLFIPKGQGTFPAIVTLYGGNKRRHVTEDAAGILSNYGYVTLALAYFGVDDLPKIYTSQPMRIEYFEEAVQFLSNHSKVDTNNIGVFGQSKGGDVALGMMSHLSKIKSFAFINTCISSVGATTTYKGKSTDMLGLSPERIEFLPDQTLIPRNILNNPRDEPNSIHNFETSKADILMIASGDDHLWKSDLYVDIAKERMDAFGKTNYEIIKYPGLGHHIDSPYAPISTTFPHILAPKGTLVYFGGKDKKQHAKQQVNVWKKVIAFYNKTLKAHGDNK